MVLSIIIPSFQQGKYLEKALLSIREQSFTDYEVLVMDGGSSDTTRAVVEELKHSAMHFYQAPDKGIYDAMNKGVALSKGDYLYFMGCDDRLASNTVLHDVFSNPKNIASGFIYGDVIFTKEGNRYDGKFNQLKLISKNICHQAIFTRRTVFEKLGGFDLKYKYLADWHFNMKCFAASWVKKSYVPVIVAYYNNDGSSFNYPDVEFGKDRLINNKKYFSRIVRFLDARHGRLYRLGIKYLP